MSEKQQYIPLTINRGKTKANILAAEQDQKRYAHRRRISQATLCRILLDGKHAYPYQTREKSAFQKALRKLQADGYLVEQKDDDKGAL